MLLWWMLPALPSIMIDAIMMNATCLTLYYERCYYDEYYLPYFVLW